VPASKPLSAQTSANANPRQVYFQGVPQPPRVYPSGASPASPDTGASGGGGASLEPGARWPRDAIVLDASRGLGLQAAKSTPARLLVAGESTPIVWPSLAAVKLGAVALFEVAEDLERELGEVRR